MLKAYRAVITIILSMAFVACGSGMMGSFMPVRLNQAGLSSETIGSIVTAFSIGMLCGCIFSGRVIRRAGHIRSYAAFASLTGLAILAMSWHDSMSWWIPLRFIHGFCSTSIFTVVQSWLNERTDSQYRGQIMAFFYVTYTLAYGSGALLLPVMEIESLAPFMIGCGLYIFSVIPISTTRIPGPEIPERISIDIKAVYRLSPVALVGAFISGATGMTLQGVGAIYGTMLGLTPAAIGFLMAGTQGGNLIIQWPLGFLSDRIDRRLVLIGATAAISVVSFIIMGITAESFLLLILVFSLFGGLSESVYSISTAHANDWAEGNDYLTLSSTILVVWSVGASVGPLVVTPLMSVIGPVGLPIYAAVVAGGYGLFAIWRMFVREEPPQDEQESFTALPPAPVSSELAPQDWSDDEAVEAQ